MTVSVTATNAGQPSLAGVGDSPNEERASLIRIARDDVEWDWNLETNLVWWSGGLKARLGYDDENDAQNAD